MSKTIPDTVIQWIFTVLLSPSNFLSVLCASHYTNSPSICYPNPYKQPYKAIIIANLQWENQSSWKLNLSEVTQLVLSSRDPNSGPFQLLAGACKGLCNFILIYLSPWLHRPPSPTSVQYSTATRVFTTLRHPKPIPT